MEITVISDEEARKELKYLFAKLGEFDALRAHFLLESLESKLVNALAANERDRTKLLQVVRSIDEEITGWMGLIEGRGPYEWDDDRYRQEFGWAVNALQEKLEPLRKIAGDLRDSPTTQTAVDAARASRSSRCHNCSM